MVKKQAHATPQEVWDLLREFQKENDRGFKELRDSQKDTDRQMKETDRQVNKTSQKVEDLSNSIEKQGKNLDKANGNFNNKWGAFIERLIAGDLVSLLEEQGIPVRQITSRKILYREDKTELGEYDLIAYNGDAIVITEVKNTLTRGKIDKFLKKLESYKKKHLIYSDKKVFGAMGFLESEEGSADYAESKGLFVIRSPEGKSDMSKIVNKEGFKPTPF